MHIFIHLYLCTYIVHIILSIYHSLQSLSLFALYLFTICLSLSLTLSLSISLLLPLSLSLYLFINSSLSLPHFCMFHNYNMILLYHCIFLIYSLYALISLSISLPILLYFLHISVVWKCSFLPLLKPVCFILIWWFVNSSRKYSASKISLSREKTIINQTRKGCTA